MPEFERDQYGPEDFYQAQLKHYGIKQGRTPDAKPAPQDPPVPLRRKPVPSGSSANRGRSPRSGSPAPRPGSPRTRSPARKIYRKEDGRFDPSTIQGKEPPRQAPTPPASPSSWKPKQRTNSNASTSSWSSRRESFTRGVRRLSDAVKKQVDIVKMDRHERLGYVRTKHDEVQKRTPSPSPQPQPRTPATPPPVHIAGKFQEHLDDEPAAAYPFPSSQSSTPTKPKPGNLTKGEQFAISLSKAADPLKPKRKGTQDSDMSFGMTDLAPPGAMEVCADCAKPTSEYLVKGLCRQCHEVHARVAKARRERDDNTLFVDPWQFPQGRTTWPDIPTADQKYMKLPNQKKIVRIRDTIYEDPGNPFADEPKSARVSPFTVDAHQKPLPPPPAHEGVIFDTDDPFDINPFEDGAFSRLPAEPKSSRPAQERKGSIDLRKHRRSKSIAVPLTTPSENVGEYVAPRTFWRKASAPNTHLSNPIPPSHDSWRDTKFYGFYDDLIQDYGDRRSKL